GWSCGISHVVPFCGILWLQAPTAPRARGDPRLGIRQDGPMMSHDPRTGRRAEETLDEFQLAEDNQHYRVDIERIRFSPYFSRLSAVTQVIAQTGAGLAVHNRLTHSVKVSAVARAIAMHLHRDDGDMGEMVFELGGCHPVVV